MRLFTSPGHFKLICIESLRHDKSQDMAYIHLIPSQYQNLSRVEHAWKFQDRETQEPSMGERNLQPASLRCLILPKLKT